MGFFSKVWKGIKGTFKKIGKGIKKTFNKFGKFMGKIGILGQIAMMFILPGIGNALLSSVMNLASWGAQAGGLIGGIAKGAAWTLGKAQQFAQFAKGTFSDLTKPITGFFKTAGKYVGSKLQKVIPGFKLPAKWNIPENYTLEQARTEWWQESVVENWKAFKDESSNFFSRSIESVLPKTGPIDLGTDEFGEVQTLVPEISPDMSARDKRLFGETPFVEGYHIEHQLPARGGLPAPPPSIGYPDETKISEILQNTKGGVYTPPDPTVTPPAADPEITWADRMRQAPEKAWDAGMARIGGDTASSLLSGERRGVWAEPAEPYSRRSGVRGTFQGEAAMLAPDQDLTAFMSFEDTYKPADPFGLWGGQSNYRNYLNRFAPTQLKYA